MVYLLALVLLLASGCSSSLPEAQIERYPQLIESPPLPPPPAWFHRSELILNVRVYVNSEGSVRDVVWLESSNDKDWDVLARDAILKWKYLPATEAGLPVGVWVHHTLRVQFGEPVIIPLAEIVCPTREVADSVYALLGNRGNFEELAKKISTGPDAANGGFRGPTNIGIFPTPVREILQALKEGEVSQPVPLGDKFVIYKRVRGRSVSLEGRRQTTFR